VTNVKFYCHGTNLLGPVSSNVGNWSFVWTNLHAGTNPITAVATDNRGASSSSAIRLVKVTTTNPPPFVSITSPANWATFKPGINLPIVAQATGSNGIAITNVDFFKNGIR